LIVDLTNFGDALSRRRREARWSWDRPPHDGADASFEGQSFIQGIAMLIRGSGARQGCIWEGRKQGLLLGLALALGACAAPAAAQTYVGNDFSLGSGLLSALQTDGNADKYPPFVILQEYSPSGPATTGAIFGSAGTVNDVSFYGNGNYDFTVYALARDSSPAPNEQKFTVVAAQPFSGDATTKGVQTLATNFSVGAGDYLAFAGVGPWYPQAPNDAAGSDATYASSSEPARYPTSFTAIAPTLNQTQTFTVGAHGDTNAIYEIVPNSFENQGRDYAIGVNYTPSSKTGGGGTITHVGNVFSLTANTPITYSDGQTQEGASFNGQCSNCVELENGSLNKPLGLSLNAFGMLPSPITQTQISGKTLYSETFEGDSTFELSNPDGSILLSGGHDPLISIEGFSGGKDVLIEVDITGPVIINDDSNDLGLAGSQIPGNVYVGIFGALENGETLQVANLGSTGVNCASTPQFCVATFLDFTMDSTIEVSTTPISFTSAFPPTVPEPSTWAMLIIGFAGLGFAGWRRGRRATAA
jgi:PEP-CTERM motif